MSTAEVKQEVRFSQQNPLSTDNVISQRQFCKQWDKLAKQKARLVFLLKCRRHNLTPRFILDKVTHLFKDYKVQSQNISRKLASLKTNINQQLLNVEISICNNDISRLEQNIVQANITIPPESSVEAVNQVELHEQAPCSKYESLQKVHCTGEIPTTYPGHPSGRKLR